MLFCLPNSGILGRYPDYPIDYKFDKFETTDLSTDPCIQAVIKLEKL